MAKISKSASKKTKPILRKGPASAKKSNVFIAVKEDEPVTIVPILPTGEIVSIDLHAFWVVNPAVTFACIKDIADDEECPGCKLGDKPGYRAFLPVIDSEGELKVFGFGISVERQLVTLEDELGGIVGLKLRVKRTGTGLSTKYQVINLGKTVEVDVEDEEAAAFVEKNIEVKERAKIVEELKAAKLWKFTSADDTDEEDSDDEEDSTTEDEDEEEAPKKKVKPTSKPEKVEKPAKGKVAKKKKDEDDDDWG